MTCVNVMFETHPLVLSLRSDGLKNVDPTNVNEMHNIWNAFSKAKNCIDGGDRLEYLSWRLYSRELIRMKSQESLALKEFSPPPSDSETDSDIEVNNPPPQHQKIRSISSVEIENMFSSKPPPLNEPHKNDVCTKVKSCKRPWQLPKKDDPPSSVVRGFDLNSVSKHEHILSKPKFFIQSDTSEPSSPVNNEDEWDDITEEETSTAPIEFNEVDVPEKVELKRSLLSSLILNKINNNDLKPTANEVERTPESSAPKFEMRSTPITAMSLTSPVNHNWANQHEDIYDPMNYHSRGW